MKRDSVSEYVQQIHDHEKFRPYEVFSDLVLGILHAIYDHFGQDNMGRQFRDTIYSHHYRQLLKRHWATLHHIRENTFSMWVEIWRGFAKNIKHDKRQGISDLSLTNLPTEDIQTIENLV